MSLWRDSLTRMFFPISTASYWPATRREDNLFSAMRLPIPNVFPPSILWQIRPPILHGQQRWTASSPEFAVPSPQEQSICPLCNHYKYGLRDLISTCRLPGANLDRNTPSGA